MLWLYMFNEVMFGLLPKSHLLQLNVFLYLPQRRGIYFKIGYFFKPILIIRSSNPFIQSIPVCDPKKVAWLPNIRSYNNMAWLPIHSDLKHIISKLKVGYRNTSWRHLVIIRSGCIGLTAKWNNPKSTIAEDSWPDCQCYAKVVTNTLFEDINY